MKTLKLMLLSAGMMILALPTANAQQAKIITSDQDGWRKVAETTVDFEKDKDVLLVFGKDRFRKLQFMVMDAPIEITSMIVYYEGGTRDTINVSSRIEEGARSRVIDLEGSKPEIGRIVFNYSTSHENWNNSSSMSTDRTTRSASTRKTTGMDEKTTVTTGTGTENERNTTTATDNTSTYGNSNTITGTTDGKNTNMNGTVNGTTGTVNGTTGTTGTTGTVSGTTSTTGTTGTVNGTAGTTTRTTEVNSTTTTKTGTMNDGNMKPGTTAQNTNTSKQMGETKTNNSTKARVILWGLK